MEHEEYFLAVRGYLNRVNLQMQIFRKHAAIVITPWLKNPPSPVQIWQIDGDEEMFKQASKESAESALAVLKKFKETPTKNIIKN